MGIQGISAARVSATEIGRSDQKLPPPTMSHFSVSTTAGMLGQILCLLLANFFVSARAAEISGGARRGPGKAAICIWRRSGR
jgi:hypothetical protein